VALRGPAHSNVQHIEFTLAARASSASSPPAVAPKSSREACNGDAASFRDHRLSHLNTWLGESPPSPEQGPVRVGGDVKSPKKIHGIPSVYPDIARQARIEGVVIPEAIIDPLGNVTNLRVLTWILSSTTFDTARARPCSRATSCTCRKTSSPSIRRTRFWLG
jgi:hypothetical protein